VSSAGAGSAADGSGADDPDIALPGLAAAVGLVEVCRGSVDMGRQLNPATALREARR